MLLEYQLTEQKVGVRQSNPFNLEFDSILPNSKNISPSDANFFNNTYNNIVKESSSIKITYDEFIKYGQLNENILLSFIDIIKEKLGILK